MKGPTIAPTSYLAQVVERVLPTEPTLQRRQPALFELVRPGAGARLQDAVDEVRVASSSTGWREDASVASTPAAQRDEAVPPPPAAAPATPAQAVAANATVRPRAPEPGEAQVAVKREPTVPREPPGVDTSVRVVTLNVAPRPAPIVVAPQAAAPVPARAARRADAPRAAPVVLAPQAAEPAPMARRVAPSAAEGAAPESPHRPAGPAAGAPTPLRRVRHAEAAAPVASRPAVPPPMPSRAALRAAAQAAARPAGPPPARELPPVEVTIGRVEVHAIVAPASAARSQRTAPRLSLDQYLRERHGGGP